MKPPYHKCKRWLRRRMPCPYDVLGFENQDDRDEDDEGEPDGLRDAVTAAVLVPEVALETARVAMSLGLPQQIDKVIQALAEKYLEIPEVVSQEVPVPKQMGFPELPDLKEIGLSTPIITSTQQQQIDQARNFVGQILEATALIALTYGPTFAVGTPSKQLASVSRDYELLGDPIENQLAEALALERSTTTAVYLKTPAETDQFVKAFGTPIPPMVNPLPWFEIMAVAGTVGALNAVIHGRNVIKGGTGTSKYPVRPGSGIHGASRTPAGGGKIFESPVYTRSPVRRPRTVFDLGSESSDRQVEALASEGDFGGR